MVSVIVPVYNASQFVEKCISSIIRQTCRDIEIILVDDGSTDDSGSICDRAALTDNRIRVIHQKNGGASVARNTGIKASHGQWLKFVDADDILADKAIETLLKAVNETDCDIAIGSMHIAREYSSMPSTNKGLTDIISPETAIERLLYQNGADSCVVAKLFKRDLFGDIQFPSGKNFEDLWILPRLYAKASKIAVTSSVIYFYRQHEASFMSHFSHARLDILDVTEDLSEWIHNNFPSLRKAANDRRFSACFGVIALLYKENIGRRDEENRCWETITSLRSGILADKNVRLKNKAGAIASYFGRGFIKMLSK